MLFRSKALIERENISNIYMYGRYSYHDVHNFYNLSDLIWAAYPASNLNSKLAISNKFFESILFKKPGVFNINTALGNYVDKYKIGYTVEPESLDCIDNLFNRILNNDQEHREIINNIKRYSRNNSIYWDNYKFKKLFALMT